MSDDKQVLANLEFLTVAEFLHYVETEAQLQELSTSAIYSFQVVPRGLESLLTRKQTLLKKLEGNNQRLAEWVELHHPKGDAKEKAILRSLYYQTRISIQIVLRHIRVVERLIDQANLSTKLAEPLRMKV